MKKLLREHFPILLNEEIDYSRNIATIYHLTGSKTQHYDQSYKRAMSQTPSKLKDEIESSRKNKKRRYKRFSLIFGFGEGSLSSCFVVFRNGLSLSLGKRSFHFLFAGVVVESRVYLDELSKLPPVHGHDRRYFLCFLVV